MNKKLLLIPLLIFLISIPFLAQAKEKVIFFYGFSCPHCDKVEEYMESINLKEKVDLEKREVYFNPENADLFNKYC